MTLLFGIWHKTDGSENKSSFIQYQKLHVQKSMSEPGHSKTDKISLHIHSLISVYTVCFMGSYKDLRVLRVDSED